MDEIFQFVETITFNSLGESYVWNSPPNYYVNGNCFFVGALYGGALSAVQFDSTIKLPEKLMPRNL